MTGTAGDDAILDGLIASLVHMKSLYSDSPLPTLAPIVTPRTAYFEFRRLQSKIDKSSIKDIVPMVSRARHLLELLTASGAARTPSRMDPGVLGNVYRVLAPHTALYDSITGVPSVIGTSESDSESRSSGKPVARPHRTPRK